MLNKIRGLFYEEQGQGLTEYGLLLSVVIVVVVAALVIFNDSLAALFESVGTAITDAISGV